MFYSDEEDEIANSKKSNKLAFDEQEKENMYRDPLELVHKFLRLLDRNRDHVRLQQREHLQWKRNVKLGLTNKAVWLWQVVRFFIQHELAHHLTFTSFARKIKKS
jgi:hypothetical protein